MQRQRLLLRWWARSRRLMRLRRRLMRLRWRRLKRRHGLGRRLRRPRRFRPWLWFCLGRFRFRLRRRRRCRDTATVVVRSWTEAGAANVSAPMAAEAGAADVPAPVALPLPWVMVRARVDRLQRRDLRLESFSLGALSLRDPAPSQVEVIGVELDVDGLAPARSSKWAAPVPVPSV